MGILIDAKGPRSGVFVGAVALALGYFPLYSAYEKGAGSLPVAVLCIASFLTGLGSCSAFSGAIKVCATNWPQHRGTATAFPLSGFGLSAFAFTTIGGFAFPDDTGSLLLLLAIGTFVMVFIGMFFLRMLPPTSVYQHVPTDDDDRPELLRGDSNELHRSNSKTSKKSGRSGAGVDPGKRSFLCLEHVEEGPTIRAESHEAADEDSSLLSYTGDHPDQDKTSANDRHHSHNPDITGWALVRSGAFWNLFIMLALLCGVGLMTIK